MASNFIGRQPTGAPNQGPQPTTPVQGKPKFKHPAAGTAKRK